MHLEISQKEESILTLFKELSEREEKVLTMYFGLGGKPKTTLEEMIRSLQASIHDSAHGWWGGSMGFITNAAACLPFYALHGFIDWECV